MANKPKINLTKKIIDCCDTQLNMWFDDSRNWTLEQVVQEIYNQGITRGAKLKMKQIKEMLEIRE